MLRLGSGLNIICCAVSGGLGLVAPGLSRLLAVRLLPNDLRDADNSIALNLCVIGLLGVFAVGYPGYFVFDAIWPSSYYSPIASAKNAWLLGQAPFIAIYFTGAVVMFNAVRRALNTNPAIT